MTCNQCVAASCSYYCVRFVPLYSARMMWHGPPARMFRPESRRFTLIIKNSTENQFLRERAVRCLADHEIGTHFVSFD